MTTKELFIAKVKDEVPRFVRVFKALPADRLDYKPDPKSRSAIELASYIASEAHLFMMLLESHIIDFTKMPPQEGPMFKTPDEAAGAFETTMLAVADKVAQASDEEWDQTETAMILPGEPWKSTLGMMLWDFLLDTIHHRGQLSTYIRPMGGKVPSIYGPSGDMM